jgi:hypothetical protein
MNKMVDMKTERHSSSHILGYVILGIILFLVVLRMILPTVVKGMANKRLEKESPYFSFHINDIDLHIMKGSYTIEGITGVIKENNEQFLNIASVTAGLPWKFIFQGEPLADVLVTKLNVSASQKLLDTAKLEQQRLKKELAEKDDEKKEESPLMIRSFVLRDSNVTVHDFLSLKGKETRTLSDINVLAVNLTPTKEKPVTDFSLTANVFGPAPLNVRGIAKIKDEPLSWDMNAVLKNFDLKSLNPFIREKVKAFIHKGKLDMFAEAAAKGKEIKGYVKPFVTKLKMDTPSNGFKIKGAAAAMEGKMVKVLLTNTEDKTLATEAPFTFNKKLKIEIIPILQKAIAYKTKQNIEPGLDDKIGQQGLGVKEEVQAQEE